MNVTFHIIIDATETKKKGYLYVKIFIITQFIFLNTFKKYMILI